MRSYMLFKIKHPAWILSAAFFLSGLHLTVAQQQVSPAFSTAGFYTIPETGREVFSMNPVWRFFRGDAADAYRPDYADTSWQVVHLPHGIEVLPEEASGGVNYQGVAWYRKHFEVPEGLEGKKLFLHFEAIMGKSVIWLNGQELNSHYGGYLPAVVDITEFVNHDGYNVIAVKADNSDDPEYPPGKPQDMLDFCYFGGIYRDCWLIAHNKTYITDPNYDGIEARGGLFISFGQISEQRAEVLLQLHIKNELRQRFSGKAVFRLKTGDGQMVGQSVKRLGISPGKDQTVSGRIEVIEPSLWLPEAPYLYNLEVLVLDAQGRPVDGYMQKTGIRSIEFRGSDGLWLNGKLYPQPLIGANRHQDFALIGNALPNSVHWRDAKKLRDAGLKVVRNAHYPQDPAFMDACDELGLFVIVNTPGWQFWNENPVFEERIYQNIRDMIRRDRNHPCVLMWEPVLNETWYPEHFARNTRDLVLAEYPFRYCYTVCDAEARGNEYFPVLYAHPRDGDADRALKHTDPSKTYFTREWGDNVDDWNSHNSPSRVHRSWGESAMLTQAQHYAHPPYTYTSLHTLYQTGRQHVGGCLWHPFDHNRGYHPDPFYGGIMDAFRQPKTSYHLFRSQQNPAESGPMVYIAHEMTPFSPDDITVYSNCETVRLTIGATGQVLEQDRTEKSAGLPYPPFVFKDSYRFMDDKVLAMDNQHVKVYLQAEGIIGGKVVATQHKLPARRPSRLLLRADNENMPLLAGGSDCVTVIAFVADDYGNIKRLNNEDILFEIAGEGSLIGNSQTGINPAKVNWGTAAALVRSGLNPGTIIVKASVIPSGGHKPLSAILEIKTYEPYHRQVFDQQTAGMQKSRQDTVNSNIDGTREELQLENERLRRELNLIKLKEVERQQKEFGEKPE
ncbi:glycosyl hydrolases family 2, sugar binding domain [Lentimicrobium saccharophilum]|uniref:Glycosyl hydrolases family 2, sugar binding domain n=1 Tax=Lentimicrobium saccharophilum TaxID=1678841 RepID=A0A0S7C1T7_9BACT|nr:glycoside hydrolase family 2 TIM barrel-domain containing protein [Lentimicrobium saccharophilum]GAP44791.1 glycosyl hydrolases family 2, sugar binding domain [Lentimicrobium saccharophilum]